MRCAHPRPLLLPFVVAKQNFDRREYQQEGKERQDEDNVRHPAGFGLGHENRRRNRGFGLTFGLEERYDLRDIDPATQPVCGISPARRARVGHLNRCAIRQHFRHCLTPIGTTASTLSLSIDI